MDDTKTKIKVKVKKKKINLRKIILFLLILYLIYFIISSIIYMPIKNIYITGNNILKDKEIIELASLADYPSYILNTKSTIKEKIVTNDYIKDVKVSKKFFGKIIIDIVEYKILCINKSDKIILESGEELTNNYHISSLPILINDIDSNIYSKFIKYFSKIDINVMNQISEIEYTPLELDKERFLLYMNDSNYVYITLSKINKVNKYNEIKGQLEGKFGTINLDDGDFFEERK